MQGTILLVVLMLLLVCMPTATADMTTYFVAKTGSDTSGTGSLSKPFKTIKKAITKLHSGDTLCIRSGTYNEKITISGLQGASSAWITIKNYNNEVVILDATGNSIKYDGIFMLKDGCKFIRITGLELRNTKGHGIFLNGGEISNIRIDHCKIHDTESSGIYAYSTESSTGKYVRNIEFDNNIVYNVNKGLSYSTSQWSPQEAISFSNVQGFNIHHNTLSKYSKEGIDCKSGSSNGEIHHNTITTSLDSPTFMWDFNHIGIYIDGYSRINKNIRIYSNMITGYGGSGIVINAEHPESGGGLKDISIYGNTIDIGFKQGYTQFRGIDSLDDAPWTNVFIYSNTISVKSNNPPIRIFPSAKKISVLVIKDNILSGKSLVSIFYQKLTSSEITKEVALSNNVYTRIK